MVSDRAVFSPSAQLGVDLERQDVSSTGFWWCRKCHRISEPKDSGDPWPQCVHCGRRTLEHKEPTPPREKPAKQWVSPERGRELFAGVFAAVDGGAE